MSESADDTAEKGLIRLADYSAPSAPTHDALGRLVQRVRILFGRDGKTAVEDDGLDRASKSTLEDYLEMPDCEVVSREIRASLDDWTDEDATSPRVRVLIMSPCETRGLVERFARSHGLQMLEPPPRTRLARGVDLPRPSLEGEGVLVVPNLERWFLRHRHGLDSVRELLRALAATDRRCLVSTNAWAWSFLVKAARMDLLVPEPLTVQPFDAKRLRAWFLELLSADGDTSTIRSVKDDEDVLALDDEGELQHDYLKELAARSNGIPWVAWQLWRRGLRTRRNDSSDEDTSDKDKSDKDASDQVTEGEQEDDDDTLWITHEAPLQLPIGYEHDAQLLLHALLIHDCLAAEQLAEVVPVANGVKELVRAMLRSGLIAYDREQEGYRCLPSAYPAVRFALDAAGFPMAEL